MFELDAQLLLALTRVKETYPWEDEFIPQVAINEASKILARENAVHFRADELSTRLQVLKKRHDTFNEVVATNGATWDVKHEIVVAREEVWSDILKVSIYITYLHYFCLHANQVCNVLMFVFNHRETHSQGPTTITTSLTTKCLQFVSALKMSKMKMI